MTRSIERPDLDAPASEWLVYGDALQEANDLRGELVGLSHAADEGRADAAVRDAYVTKHAKALLGFDAPLLAPYQLTWRFSEVASVEVRIGASDDGAKLVRRICESPAAQLLRAVTLVGIARGEERVDLGPAMVALGTYGNRIKSLAFIDDRASRASMLVSRDFDPDANLVALGALAPFWEFAEHVRLVVADSHVLELDEIDAPELRSFSLDSLRFADWEDATTMCQRLGKARWPKLETFELRLVETWVANVPDEVNPYVAIYSADDYEGRDDFDEGEAEGINWSELGPLLKTLAGCPLRRLALTSFESARSLLEALAKSGLAPTLKELDLSDSNLGDEDAAWMVAHPELFRALDRLVLERTAIGAAGLESLRKLGPQIVHSEGSGARYRYVVGQE